jgi:hypothetical protein
VEAVHRGYNFNSRKIDRNFTNVKLAVTIGQLKYEAYHLLNKLKKRDRKKYKGLRDLKKFSPHPMFKIKKGGVEKWERT